MSYVRVRIKPAGSEAFLDVTKDVTSVMSLSEYNDESSYFSGVFRKSNISISLDNTFRAYSSSGRNSIFQNGRDNSIVELAFVTNKGLPPIEVFKGVIDEGQTENDLTKKETKILVVDYTKFLRDINIVESDIKAIDTAYGSNPRLNSRFIQVFLNYIFNKGDGITDEFTFDSNISCGVESIFPASDSYYNSNNQPALNVLQELLRSVNSYSVIRGGKLFIKARPREAQALKYNILTPDILEIKNQSDGYNRIFNSITINGFSPRGASAYTRASSIEKYGTRSLNIDSYASASLTLANNYLDYYAEPKVELDLVLRMNEETLALLIGDKIRLNLPEIEANFRLQPIDEEVYIIRREVIFDSDIITLRLREL